MTREILIDSHYPVMIWQQLTKLPVGQSLAQHSVLLEPANQPEVSQRSHKAFDLRDEHSRIEMLSEVGLSAHEQQQVARQEQWLALTAHLAEVAKLSVYPYKLAIHSGRLGSQVQLGAGRYLFRDMIQMLESRVVKFPTDTRSSQVLESMRTSIIPKMLTMKEGDTGVYFSPAGEGQGEFEYGFAYLVTRNSDDFDCLAIMLEGWEVSDYVRVVESFGYDLPKKDYQSLTSQFLYFIETKPEQVWAMLQGAFDSRGYDELDWLGSQTWLKKKLLDYQRVQAFVEPYLDRYTKALLSGDQSTAKQLLQQLQLDWLAKSRPFVYKQTIDQLSHYGYSKQLLACGVLEFASSAHSLPNWGMMAVPDFLTWSMGYCRVRSSCPNKDKIVLVGPCQVCWECEQRANRGEKLE